jgi:N-acetylmuramoyl-L-alanine amidase
MLAASALAAATLLAGTSAEGRPIKALQHGGTGPTVLVVGSIHGNETAGHDVIRALRRDPPRAIDLHTVLTVNPDGVRRGIRQNARGVDLNRNFPARWRGGGRPFDTYFPGRAAGSEPETKAVMRLARRIAPRLTVYFHQQLRMVVDTEGTSDCMLDAYARVSGLPKRRLPRYRGTAVAWENARGGDGMVVELPAGRLSRAAVRRHVRAIVAAAACGHATPEVVDAAAKPAMEQTPIRFGTTRKRQMKAYARRHYGLDTHLLREPRTIVQHYTASTTFSSAFNTFAANARDPELRELPGVCAHFLIDRDGAIHQLVDTRFMCRHTIGLNHRAIGIEHVGTSDAQVMGNARQLAASLRLTRWLMAEHGIQRRHVIGHAESLRSPFHFERVPALRTRTHGDFPAAVMRRYRGRL